jgi:hypothetical protein
MKKFLPLTSLFLLISTFCFAIFRPILFDYDMGRHLLFGKIMLQTKNIISTNLLSYTYPNFHYINSHWLSEIIFYLIYSSFGAIGLTVFSAIIILLTFILIFAFTAKHTSLPISILTSFIYLYLILTRIDVRPEIFSYLFLVIFLIILYRFKRKFTKLIYLLIPLQILWVNLHINFLIGIIILFIFLSDAFFSSKLKIDKNVKTIFMVFMLCTIGSLINPHGLSGLLNPLNLSQNFSQPVDENQNFLVMSTIYSYRIILPLIIPQLILLIVLILNRKKAILSDILLSIFFILISLFAVRNVALFAFATFFLFTSHLFDLTSVIQNKLKKIVSLKQIIYLNYLLMYLLLITAFVFTIKVNNNFTFGIGIEENGKQALDFFIKNGLKGPIYNNVNFGQYIAYRLYPKEKVFYDGRPEAYPISFYTKIYFPMQNDIKIFNKYAQKYKFNTIVLDTWNSTPKEEVLLNYFFNPKNTSYSLIYLDSYSAIFIKNEAKNINLINTFLITENKFKILNPGKKDLVRYLFLFKKIGWKDQESIAYTMLKEKDPSGCLLWENLSKINSNLTTGIKLEKNLHCY